MDTATQGPKPVDRFLALAGVAMGIAFFLAPKTPLIIVLSLLAMFAVLFHVVWNFWWIEKSQLRRILSLTILAALLFVFGVSVWPLKVEVTTPLPPSNWTLLINSFSSWTAGYMAFVGGLPWHWIVPSLAIGVLTATLVARRLILLRDRKRQEREQELQALACPERALHERKANDKDRIKELVRIAGICYQPHFDSKGAPHIDFVFSVFNISLYDIVIDSSIRKGTILFGGDFEKFFYEPRIEANQPNQPNICRSRSSSYFVIHQAVRAEEVTRFQEADSVLIAFDNLDIRFRVAEQSSATETDPALEIKQYLETKKGIWRPLEQLAFVFGYTEEQWAKIGHPGWADEQTKLLIQERDRLRIEIERVTTET